MKRPSCSSCCFRGAAAGHVARRHVSASAHGAGFRLHSSRGGGASSGWGLGAQPAVWAAYGLFVTLVVVLLFFVLPLIGRQLYGFVEALPAILDQVRVFARGLPERYPTLLTQAQIDMGLEGVREEIVAAGQLVVEWLFSRLGSLVSLIIYLVLVPILVFFFLKDKGRLLAGPRAFCRASGPCSTKSARR